MTTSPSWNRMPSSYRMFQKTHTIWALSPTKYQEPGLLLTVGGSLSCPASVMVAECSPWGPWEVARVIGPGLAPHGTPGKMLFGQLEPWNCCLNVLCLQDAGLTLLGEKRPQMGCDRQEKQKVNSL